KWMRKCRSLKPSFRQVDCTLAHLKEIPLSRFINPIRTRIDSAIAAIRTDASIAGRKFGLQGYVKGGHSCVADWRLLKFGVAIHANEDPFRHLVTLRGDSQEGGEHREGFQPINSKV